MVFVLTAAPSPAGGESIGTWTATTSYPAEYANCVAHGGYAYCVGGVATNSSGDLFSATYYAQLTPSGVAAWTKTTNYPLKIWDTTCVVSGSDIYCLGGDAGNTASTSSKTAAVYYAPLSSSGIGSWTQTTNYPVASNDNKCVSESSYIYCIYGVQFGSGSTTTYYGAISGSTISWHTSTSYPVLTQDAACADASGYIYCVGNAVGHYRDVYSAPISSSGFGTWQNDTATNPLPVQGSGMSCVVNSGYLYCVGAGNVETGVYYAAVSGSSVTGWTQTIPYPLAFGYSPCVTAGSQIYCITDGISTTVYYNTIQSGSTTTITVTQTVTATITQTVTSTTTSVSTSTITHTTTVTSTTTSTTTLTSTSTTTLPASTTTSTTTVTSTSTLTGPTTTTTTTVTSTPTATVTDTTTTTSTQTQTVTATTTPTVTTTQTQTTTVYTGPTTTETSTQILTSTKTVPTTVTSTSVSTSTETVPATATSTNTETTTQSPSTVTSTLTITSPVTTTITNTGPFTLSVFAKAPQGTPVPNVVVTLESSSGTAEQGTTNSNGEVVYPSLSSGGTYSVSAVVDGTSLGTQVTMSSNAIVVLEPNSVSVTNSSTQSPSSSGNPLFSSTPVIGLAAVLAAILAILLFVKKSRKP